ncbi:hypothetical protein ACAG39_11680 [Caldicellulosiruptoraceae bacterium PP1]
MGFQDIKRTYFYFPLVTQSECTKVENRSFVQRVYGGALKLVQSKHHPLQQIVRLN